MIDHPSVVKISMEKKKKKLPVSIECFCFNPSETSKSTTRSLRDEKITYIIFFRQSNVR